MKYRPCKFTSKCFTAYIWYYSVCLRGLVYTWHRYKRIKKYVGLAQNFLLKYINVPSSLQSKMGTGCSDTETFMAIQEIVNGMQGWNWDEVKAHLCCVPVGNKPNMVWKITLSVVFWPFYFLCYNSWHGEFKFISAHLNWLWYDFNNFQRKNVVFVSNNTIIYGNSSQYGTGCTQS